MTSYNDAIKPASSSMPRGYKCRADVINRLIETRGYRSYLEIGVLTGETFHQIRAASKESVDTTAAIATYKMTSDKFFARYPAKRYDIIFIDALHVYDQVLRDARNALKALWPGGVVVVHDCNPESEVLAAEDHPGPGIPWCGTAWRAIVELRVERKLRVCVVDVDHGCGVITREAPQPSEALSLDISIGEVPRLPYSLLAARRNELLNLVGAEEFERLYVEPRATARSGNRATATMQHVDYHTRDAHDARLRERAANPTVPAPLYVYYHAALMPGWKSIVEEQIRLFDFVGLRSLHVGVIGEEADVRAMLALAQRWDVELEIIARETSFQEYEMPTLRPLWQRACREPGAAFLYTHTKGASAPNDEGKRQWRRIMAFHVIASWKDNLALLAEYDIVGANWQNCPSFPHFQGNFWTARGDWLAHLPDPLSYRDENSHARFAGQDFRRMFAESYLGCRPWHHVKSLFCEDHQWFHSKEQTAYAYREIPGFVY